MMRMWRYAYCFGGTLLILLDRCTKVWAEKYFGTARDVTSFFSLELSHNTGVSFGLFADRSAFVFWFLTILIVSLLAVFFSNMIQRARTGHVVIGEMLIFAGGVGNIWDRLWYGYVIDFISFHYNSWSFPNFNIADICIVLGVSILMMQLFVEEWNARS